MPLFVGASESYDTDAWEAYNLKKENAKLRDELDAAKHDLSLFSERIVELGAENAKLRELVKDFFDVPCQCLKCKHYNYEEDRCDLHDLARELGVGVDG